MSPDAVNRAWFLRWIVMSFESIWWGQNIPLGMDWLVDGWVDINTPFHIVMRV